jgi:hypothetical protein
MGDELYRVVFTGRLVEGASGKQTLANLAQLFKKSPEEIRKVFSKPGTVIRSNLPLLKAEKMLAGLTRAGALCQIEVVSQKPDKSVSAKAVTADKYSPPENVLTGRAPQIFALTPMKGDLTLDPITCGRITSHPGGLETARLDRSFVAFTDILAVVVFSLEERSTDFKILLFTAGHKRPLLTEGMQVAFGEFPGVAGESISSSLRNFLCFLAIQNPDLCVDETTASYMKGGVALVRGDDPLLLATEIHTALVSAGIDCNRPAQNAPDPETVVAPKPVQSHVAKPPVEPIAQESPTPVREIDLRAEIGNWVDRWPLPLAICLLVGFLLPFLKKSLLYDSFNLIWFWNQLGFGVSGEQAAAMATYSSSQWGAAYALLPLISFVLVLLTAFAVPKSWRGLILFLAGSVPLLLAFTLFFSSGEIYGLIFLPNTAAGGGLMLALLFCALLVATVNHLAKHVIYHLHLRMLQGLGSLMLLLLTVLAFIAPDWNNFAMYLLYLVWLAIALLSLKGAITGANDEGNLSLISLLFRVALVLTPVAVIVAQSMYDNPFVTYVIESGGGVSPLILSSLKAFLIYYSMAIATGVGLVQILGQRYAGR